MSNYDKVAKLACKPTNAPPKLKYIDTIVAATWSEGDALRNVCKALSPLFHKSNPVIVFKALIVLHTMIRNGATNNVLAYLSQSDTIQLHNVHFGSWQGSRNPDHFHAYVRYLEFRIRAYRDLGYDAIKVQEETNRDLRVSSATEEQEYRNGKDAANKRSILSRSQTVAGRKSMTMEEGLLRETKVVHQIIDSLIECRFYMDSMEELHFTALRMLVKDLVILFQVGNEAIINTLERYFEMSFIDASEALWTYRHFCKQTELVTEYLGVAKKLQNLLNVPIPNLRYPPLSLATPLQEYLNDPNFEQNRMEYKAEKAAAEGKPTPKTSPANNTKAPTTNTESPTSTSPNADKPSVSSPLTSQQQDGSNAGDFFSSIGAKPSKIVFPQSTSPAQRAASNPFSPLTSQQQGGSDVDDFFSSIEAKPSKTVFPQTTSRAQRAASNPFSQMMTRQQSFAVPQITTQSTALGDTSPLKLPQSSQSATPAPESRPSPQLTPASIMSTTSAQDYPQANTSSGFLNQAHNIAILNPSMYDIGAQHNYYLGSTNVLDCLARYIMTGVEYNSSIREHSPRCHPGTREDIIQDIQADLHTPDRKVKMIWMCGPAGVGKSTIMQTLAEARSQDILGAALFISKVDKRNEPRRIFPTVAYQLAVRNPSYQAYIGERFKADPTFLEKSLAEQFESLVTIPFTSEHIVLGSEQFIILIDGLDECQNERDQCKIIDLIHSFVAHHPTSPFTWAIASRPELHLQTVFARAKDNLETYKEHRICVHSEQACKDVESYLRHEFTRIQQNYSDSISSAPPWPTNRQFLKIASASSGLFPFASSVLEFIDSGDPVSRLHHTLAFLDGFGPKTPSPNENPFQALDVLYAQIMSEIPADTLSVTKALLGYYLPKRIALPTHNKAPLLLACNLLGIKRHIAYGALRRFYSVLAFPSSANAHQEELRFLHASFPDYLGSPVRSKIYSVDLSDAMTEQWRCYARILVEWLDGYSHECVKLSWVPDLENPHHAAYELRENMFNQASSSWTVMLYRHCHSWCPASCTMKAPNSICLGLSLSEVSNFLRQVDFGVPTPFSKDPVDMLDFLAWVRDHVPMELRREILAQDFPLNKLKIPRFFQALCEKKWYRGVTERYRRFEVEIDGQGIEQIGPLDTSEWETAEEILQGDEGMLGDLVRLVLESHSANEVMVTVLGADPAKCCGVICYQKSPTEVQYHIFPYGEIYLQGSPRLTMVSLD